MSTQAAPAVQAQTPPPKPPPTKEARDTSLFTLAVGAPSLRQDGPFPKIDGYAAVFNQLSENLGGFREKIDPHAFDETLANADDVRGLVDHDPSRILGRIKAGTLRLNTDAVGLHYVIDPPDTQTGRDILVSLKRGDVDQSSFAFRTLDDNWEFKKDASGHTTATRTLLRVKLYDVSVVTYPAYPQTKVGVRALWPCATDDATEAEVRGWLAEQIERVSPRPHVNELRSRLIRTRWEDRMQQEAVELRTPDVQTVIFTKADWDVASAKQWLSKNNFRSDKLDTTNNTYRFRQFEPSQCKAGSYLTLSKNTPRGVKLVVCTNK